MNDPYAVVAVVAAAFSAIATGLAAFATWQAPRAAAQLAERLREGADRAHERQRNKLQIFAMVMQERAAIYSENGVSPLSLNSLHFLR